MDTVKYPQSRPLYNYQSKKDLFFPKILFFIVLKNEKDPVQQNKKLEGSASSDSATSKKY